MIGTYIFIGERKSQTAIDRGWSWKDGHLAAKPLFEALRAIDIEPSKARFFNLFFGEGPDENQPKPHLLDKLRGPWAGEPIVALGRKVSDRLASCGIAHVPLVHPAARGAIRKRERYHAHVRASIQRGLVSPKEIVVRMRGITMVRYTCWELAL